MANYLVVPNILIFLIICYNVRITVLLLDVYKLRPRHYLNWPTEFFALYIIHKEEAIPVFVARNSNFLFLLWHMGKFGCVWINIDQKKKWMEEYLWAVLYDLHSYKQTCQNKNVAERLKPLSITLIKKCVYWTKLMLIFSFKFS